MWVGVAAVCGEHQLMPIEARCGGWGQIPRYRTARGRLDRALRATLPHYSSWGGQYVAAHIETDISPVRQNNKIINSLSYKVLNLLKNDF